MNQHPYLRAYMAGIAVPTIFLLVVATVFTLARYVYNIPVPVERVIVFPMAFVPNVWGLWNILFVASRARLHHSLGLHGAVLPFLLGPLGYLVARMLDFPIHNIVVQAFPIAAQVAQLVHYLIAAMVGMIIYYLAWKYLVGFLNGVLGLS